MWSSMLQTEVSLSTLHAKYMDLYQSQIKWETDYVMKNGDPVNAVVEVDFWGGNGRLRLRKAFVETKEIVTVFGVNTVVGLFYYLFFKGLAILKRSLSLQDLMPYAQKS